MKPDPEPARAHFVRKWWQREPEMRLASVFCAQADPPPAGTDALRAQLRFEAWGALLHELREVLFELADPGVALAKRSWWAEELRAIAVGAARHPLGQDLQAIAETRAVPWAGLSLALLGGGGDAARGANTADALALLLPLARSVVAVENALFRAPEQDAAAQALVAHWLLQRLPRGLAETDGARIPMHLLARHGLTAAQLPEAGDALLRDWAAELALALPADTARTSYLRRARASFDAARLRRLRLHGRRTGFAEPPAPATLWRAWRAARSR